MLRRAEHWILMRAAEAAARLRAPEAVLAVSRRGVRLFAADDPAAPAWWLSVAVREPEAAGGRAVAAPPAEVWGALRATWGRAGTRAEAGPGAVRLEGRSAAAEIRGRAVGFGAGAGIPAGGGGELVLGDHGPAAVADAPPALAADVAAVAARSDAVELRFARDGRGWWIEVGGDGRVRRTPARMLLLPPGDAVAGRYPAPVLAELLSLSGLADLTVELTEPPGRPAFRAGWDAAAPRARVEVFSAPAD